MVAKCVAFIIRKPVQGLPDQDRAISRCPRGSCMPEKRRETDVRPGGSLHSAQPRKGVQRMGSFAVLNPEAASLPASTWDDDAFVPTRVVLIGVHLDLHIFLMCKRRELHPRARATYD